MMDRDKRDYFFMTLDANLRSGLNPAYALVKTVESYAKVFYSEAMPEEPDEVPFGRDDEEQF